MNPNQQTKPPNTQTTQSAPQEEKGIKTLLEELLAKESKPAQLVATDTSEFCNYLDTAKFNQMWKVACLFSKTQLVPVQYRGKADDCFVVVQMAARLGVDPLMFMQNTYMVHGKPGMEAKLVIALINNKGPFTGPIQWKFTGSGDTRECSAVGVLPNGETCKASVTMKMVKAEGWIQKKDSKWQSMPDLMFQYRSAAFLGRLYCPEVLMGMQTIDEIVDVGKDKVPFEDAQVEAQATIEDQTGSQITDANFEDQSQVNPQEESADEDWLNDKVEVN